MRLSPGSSRPRLRTRALAAATVAASLALGLGAAPARADVVTPGNFAGYGFDQCTAPSQAAMNAWLTGSPYLAVGIYVSGDSRGCTSQPNLSARWVRMQAVHGWRMLPITLGPQAWCTTRERYLHQVRISPTRSGSYSRARAQGRAEAAKTIRAAQRLGIGARSTLWYDLEAFDISPTNCRESALSFLSAWSTQLHRQHYVSGVYSSAASGIRILDDARVNRPGRFQLPDRVWIADWNGTASTASSYVRSSGWNRHQRVHQFRGGHHETYGGVTIDIDQNWVDLGRGSWLPAEPAHCGGAATYNRPRYASLAIGARGAGVRTVQCLLTSRGSWSGAVDGVYGARLGAAVSAYRVDRGLSAGTSTTRRTWVALLAQGGTRVLKQGSAAPAVRRVQRALNAADGAALTVTGIVDRRTVAAIKGYQHSHGLPSTGVVAAPVWRRLLAGIA